MATFPEIEDSPLHQGVTVPDRVDLGLLSDLGVGVGWLSGAAVNPTAGGPSYAVKVDAGVVVINGQSYPVPATAALTTGLVASGSFDRRDIVVFTAGSGLTFVTGTPCAVANWNVFSGTNPPVKPAVPANSVVLAEVYVAAGLAFITSDEIVDKRTPSVDYSIPAQLKTAPYTLVVGDQGTVIEVLASSVSYPDPTGVTVSIDSHTNQNFPLGSIIELCRLGSAQLTVAVVGGSGVVLRSPAGSVQARVQYSTIVLRKRDVDEWVLGGDLA